MSEDLSPAPPLPPSPMTRDRSEETHEARLPWYVPVAACVALVPVGAVLVPAAWGAPSVAAVGRVWVGVIWGGSPALSALLLCLADRMAGPRRRPLAWALTLGLVGCALWGWMAWEVRAWSPLALAPYFALLGAVLGLAVRARQSVPQTAGLAAALTGGLAMPTAAAVDCLIAHTRVDAGALILGAGMGAGVFGLFGLAVGLSLHFERKRLEREGE